MAEASPAPATPAAHSFRQRAAHFETELFQPLKRGIQLLSRCLSLTDSTSWLLCLDEAEYLEPVHQRLINTYMRGAMGNLQ